MEFISNLLIASGTTNYFFGARPDAAIIFLLFFAIALFFCRRIATKNHLFTASNKNELNKAKECETIK
ncbi:hypothetical protein [Anaerocolumna sp. MB42-C2]|uniref:hypothetical protein n=1 Tax=Anaerocolumna sp. MB42-C2 TaxID=3070997 RepID=UPI0027E15279|nr:hypothetical protein [Anaerocolumna sp. MB42-C2]WMJ85803.1 hypothetical protein RBU59_17245 [Anaerocolumna sp. MB42-C2]